MSHYPINLSTFECSQCGLTYSGKAHRNGLCGLCRESNYQKQKGYQVDGMYFRCFICYEEVICPLDLMDTIWDDLLYFGKPVCSECGYALRELKPTHVNYEKPKKPPTKIGILKWL